jgi:hypothetical protein
VAAAPPAGRRAGHVEATAVVGGLCPPGRDRSLLVRGFGDGLGGHGVADDRDAIDSLAFRRWQTLLAFTRGSGNPGG